MTESPFAPLKCYLSGSRVEHDLDRRYPILIAPTGSCAEAGSSVSLCIRSDPQSLQVAVSPCCIQLLPSVIPQICPRMPGPLPRWLTGCVCPLLPLSRRPSPKRHWVGFTTTFRSTTSERMTLTRLQSFVDLQASEFAATQVVPTAGILSDVRAAVAFTSEQRAVRCLPAYRIC
jgi:hypothetical protein